MKTETAEAIRKLDVAKQRELVAFMAEIMSADDFCDALEIRGKPDERTLSTDGDAIVDEMNERHNSEMVNLDDALSDIDRLHEAICEGRAQDAIDILNVAFPSAGLRSVTTQQRLFPDRVTTLNIADLF